MEIKNEKWMVEFYNRIAQDQVERFEQIPDQVQEFILYLDYEDIVKPFIAEAIASGMSRDHASQKFGILPGKCRSIGRSFGLLPRKKSVPTNQ